MYPLKRGIRNFQIYGIWRIFYRISLKGIVRKQFYQEEMEFNWLNNCHFYNPIKTTDESFFNPLFCPLIIFVLFRSKKVGKISEKTRQNDEINNKQINESITHQLLAKKRLDLKCREVLLVRLCPRNLKQRMSVGGKMGSKIGRKCNFLCPNVMHKC